MTLLGLSQSHFSGAGATTPTSFFLVVIHPDPSIGWFNLCAQNRQARQLTWIERSTAFIFHRKLPDRFL
jgi:hypothetical protein